MIALLCLRFSNVTEVNSKLLRECERAQTELRVRPEHQWHSVVACPILRQPCTEANPPMRLICGHVISRDALSRIQSAAPGYLFLHTCILLYCTILRIPGGGFLFNREWSILMRANALYIESFR